jgi:23S rRNA (uracil1939-C5)-methyltransferase
VESDGSIPAGDAPLMADPTRETVEVLVRGLSSTGSGVADLPDGRVVFVPRTAPGDRALVMLGKVKPRWAEARVVEILEASEHRKAPECALYDQCGGCSLQHLPYEAQLEWKARFVSESLARIGKIEVAPPPIVPSPDQLRYRNRITYTLRRLRGGRTVAGFHALGRPAHVIDVEDQCVLPEAQIAEAWTSLRAVWGPGARLLPDGGRLRLTLRSSATGAVLIVGGGEGGWNAAKLFKRASGIASIWHQPAGVKKARLLQGTRPGDESEADGPSVHGAAFLQVNPAAATLLEEHVLEHAGSPTRAVDAYCGIGVYGRALAARGAVVVGIESNPDALRTFDDPLEGLSALAGKVEVRLPEALPADLLILNPPRSGLDTSVPEHILAEPPQQIIYVSCDVATLARDLSRLIPAYDLVELHAFDLFPQTALVESVAVLHLAAER